MSPFRPRVALASLSGRSNAEWANAVAQHVGAAFLGGIAIDDATQAAAKHMAGRDRTEFLPPDPMAFIESELEALAPVPVRPGFNVRTRRAGALEAAGQVCARHNAILELNAHCRQPEMCAAGAGEALLTDPDRCATLVSRAARTDATVSVKVRTEVDGVDLPAVARTLQDAGADVIHVDAMDSEPMVGRVVDAVDDAAVIANNGVRDKATTHEYLSYGADAVSVGRASDDSTVLERVRRATEAWFGRRQAQSTREPEKGPAGVET